MNNRKDFRDATETELFLKDLEYPHYSTVHKAFMEFNDEYDPTDPWYAEILSNGVCYKIVFKTTEDGWLHTEIDRFKEILKKHWPTSQAVQGIVHTLYDDDEKLVGYESSVVIAERDRPALFGAWNGG